jgi:hypothetical protein
VRHLSITCTTTDATHATLVLHTAGWHPHLGEFEISLDDALPFAIRNIERLTIAFANELCVDTLSRVLLPTVRNLASHGIVEIEGNSTLHRIDLSSVERVFGLKARSDAAESIVFDRATDTSGKYTSGLVSILIAAWNPRYFEKALRSALSQTYPSIEIIVGGDRADDAIRSIIERVRGSQFPVHYTKNEPRLMVRGNYEACFDRSRGEFIKYLNDDDTLEPRCVERMVQAFAAEPTAILVTSARTLIDDLGGPKQDIPATIPLIPSDAFVDGRSLANALLMLGLNFVGEPSTVLFRRNLAKLGDEPLFDFANEFGRGVTDFVLWSKLLCRGDAVYLRERLSSFRVHAEQRQALPEVQHYAVNSIPELRNRWLELGGHLSSPPSLLRIRSIQSDVFRMHPIELFGASESNKKALTDQWRNRTHPFFQAHQ